MNRKLFNLNSSKPYSLIGLDKRTALAIQNHFQLSNYQMLVLSWVKGIWTGILISLVLHHIISHWLIMYNLFFAISYSEMGINIFTLSVILFFSFLFIFGFIYSSINMDGEGIMNWMMKKPKNWIGNRIKK